MAKLIHQAKIEDIHPKSKGGSDRVPNLTVACSKCNQLKSNQDVKEFLSGFPELLKQILTPCQITFKRCTTRLILLDGNCSRL
ncbi:MAG: hypothetical protein F6K40_36020 [Okeania sp. SIO3I5]|uniref:HNH endonuclease n=1 Tax=Okeania sp. SIO3I5 TaxID=2607805 RepID=UPI0013BC125F|nr:HNH endonuclease [Okeania sp. SIO3I5]NEQ41317.1 hypothetical protein [Okeania sp. SIO3I5]